MREFLFILLIIVLLLAFTAFRYRKQIAAVYQFWSLIQGARQNRNAEIPTPVEIETGPLVNCAKCGRWVAETAAIRLGSRSFYCSSACFERAAKAV
jgi:hypothetical protein